MNPSPKNLHAEILQGPCSSEVNSHMSDSGSVEAGSRSSGLRVAGSHSNHPLDHYSGYGCTRLVDNSVRHGGSHGRPIGLGICKASLAAVNPLMQKYFFAAVSH